MVFKVFIKKSVLLLYPYVILLVLWEFTAREIFFNLSHILSRGSSSNIVFKQLDLDSSGYLTFHEWMPHFFQCSGGDANSALASTHLLSESLLHEKAVNDKFVFQDDDFILSVKATFQPLDLNSTMKNFREEHQIHSGSMLGLLNWQVPNRPWQNFAAKQFSLFLPPKDLNMMPGNIWWIVVPQQTRQIPSDHYKTAAVSSELSFLQDLLKMFHPRPSLLTRFPPQGTAAMLRAFNKDVLDILFRSHVEFQLNEKPALPFWFTPAQFRGRLIIQRNASEVIYFSMAVPNSRALNVDMEWLCGIEPGQMEVDLGFLPEMKLESTCPSVLSSKLGKMRSKFIHGTHSDYFANALDDKWTQEIPESSAWSLLENQFFAFKSVPYYNLTEVFEKAVENDKLVHAIMLFGSLDDQSC